MCTSFLMLTILHPMVLTITDRKAVSRISLQVIINHKLTLQTNKLSIKLQFLKTLLVRHILKASNHFIIYCPYDICRIGKAYDSRI